MYPVPVPVCPYSLSPVPHTVYKCRRRAWPSSSLLLFSSFPRPPIACAVPPLAIETPVAVLCQPASAPELCRPIRTPPARLHLGHPAICHLPPPATVLAAPPASHSRLTGACRAAGRDGCAVGLTCSSSRTAPMARLATFAAALLLAGAARAHFTLDFPPTAGFDEDKEPTAPCGGFPPTGGVATDFHVGGDNLAMNLLHPPGRLGLSAPPSTPRATATGPSSSPRSSRAASASSASLPSSCLPAGPARRASSASLSMPPTAFCTK